MEQVIRGEPTRDSKGHELPYVRDRVCRYQSIFGEIDIVRAYYQKKAVEGTFPLDSQLNLPDRVYSYLLQEWAGKLAVNGSYEKAQEFIQSIFAVNVPFVPLSGLWKMCAMMRRLIMSKRSLHSGKQ